MESMNPNDMLRAQNAATREEAQQILDISPNEELVTRLEVLHEFSMEMEEAPSDFLAITAQMLPRLIELAKSN